jgi:hypothetical protein
VNELGPGSTLLLMGVVAVVVIGCGAALMWAMVANWRDRDRRRGR